MKTGLRTASLKQRLIVMLAGMALIVLLLALLIFSVAGVLRQQAGMMAQLHGLVQVVASNAESAVVFGDSQAATVSLSSLRERREIRAARISPHINSAFGNSRRGPGREECQRTMVRFFPGCVAPRRPVARFDRLRNLGKRIRQRKRNLEI